MSTSEHEEPDETYTDEHEGDSDSDHLESEAHPPDDPPEGGASEAVEPEPEQEPELEPEPEYEYEEIVEDGDHRVAQLRKMRSRFVSEGELSLPSGMLTADDTGPSLIVCPNCSSEEIRGQRFCSQCNARLPNIVVVEQKYNPGSIDGAARKYADSVHKFQTDAMSLDDFIDFLNRGLEKVRAHAEHLGELSADGVIAEWLPDAAALIARATQLWYDSVEGMLMRVEDAQIEYDEEEALLEELDEEELAEREPLIPLDDRVRLIDFTPEIESIFRANDQMLEYLRIVDDNLKSEAKVGGMQF